jgi:hypothetical protein
MSSLMEIRDGLNIFLAHGNEQDCLEGRHDVVAVKVNDPVSNEEHDALVKLGWMYNEKDDAWEHFT